MLGGNSLQPSPDSKITKTVCAKSAILVSSIFGTAGVVYTQKKNLLKNSKPVISVVCFLVGQIGALIMHNLCEITPHSNKIFSVALWFEDIFTSSVADGQDP